MTRTPALPDLADHIRRFRAAVMGALRLDARQGLLGGPFALLMWLCTRRKREQAEMAMAEAVRGLMECFAALLQQFREGKLPPAEVREEAEAKPRAASARARKVGRAQDPISTTRGAGSLGPRPASPISAAPSAPNRCKREARRRRSAPDRHVPTRTGPRRPGPVLRVLAPWARPPPGAFSGQPEGEVSKHAHLVTVSQL